MYMQYLGLLRRLFPTARFVHLIRARPGGRLAGWHEDEDASDSAGHGAELGERAAQHRRTTPNEPRRAASRIWGLGEV